MDNQTLGKIGQGRAKKYLKKLGYKIKAENYYTRLGEIDLVCQKNKILVFVEVKTRTSQSFGYPEEAVSQNKIDHLLNAAQLYLLKEKVQTDWQIDVISLIIQPTGELLDLKHFQNVS
jgi:putative endonuclease